MIRINRGECPSKLRDTPQTGDHYNHPEVVKALLEMQQKKCCYCERTLPEEGHDKHVEHFRPKTKPEFENLRNAWLNLLLACPQCNGRKSDKFPPGSDGEPLIIDPSNPEINPEEHVTFVVDIGDIGLFGQAIERSESELGRMTITITGIGSVFFKGERARYFLRTVFPHFKTLWHTTEMEETDLIPSARRDFELLMSAKSDFAAFVRAFARNARLDEALEVTIPE